MYINLTTRCGTETVYFSQCRLIVLVLTPIYLAYQLIWNIQLRLIDADRALSYY